MKVPSNLVDAIGNTPLVELQKVVPSGSARVLAKLEFENPTGSMKDRVGVKNSDMSGSSHGSERKNWDEKLPFLLNTVVRQR